VAADVVELVVVVAEFVRFVGVQAARANTATCTTIQAVGGRDTMAVTLSTVLCHAGD
jgi:hypothetical protein